MNIALYMCIYLMNIVYSTLHVYISEIFLYNTRRHFLALLYTIVTCVDQDRSDVRCIPKYLNSETLSSEQLFSLIAGSAFPQKEHTLFLVELQGKIFYLSGHCINIHLNQTMIFMGLNIVIYKTFSKNV